LADRDVVLGMEAQGDWASLIGSNRPPLGNISQFNIDTTTVRSIATATGRVGYAHDNLLLYAKGGAAWARTKNEADTTATPFGGAVVATTGLNSVYRSGWVIGAGLEYGLTPNWSVAVEYNYLDFGTQQEIIPSSVAPPGVFNAFTENVKLSVQTAAVRVNYRFGGLGAASGPAPASVADFPLKAPLYTKVHPSTSANSWSGIYAGVNVGGHWGRDSATTAPDPAGLTAAGAAAISAATPGSVKPNGFAAGEQIGYNFQAGRIVYGVEADAQWLGGSASRSVTNIAVINPADVFTTTAQSAWLGTFRGRVGTTIDRALLYVTGGAAYSGVKFSDYFGSFGNTFHSSVSESPGLWGWTIGGGVEWAIDNKWSWKAEYLFADFGPATTTIANIAGNDIAVTHKYSENPVRVGLNYRLSEPR